MPHCVSIYNPCLNYNPTHVCNNTYTFYYANASSSSSTQVSANVYKIGKILSSFSTCAANIKIGNSIVDATTITGVTDVTPLYLLQFTHYFDNGDNFTTIFNTTEWDLNGANPNFIPSTIYCGTIIAGIGMFAKYIGGSVKIISNATDLIRKVILSTPK